MTTSHDYAKMGCSRVTLQGHLLRCTLDALYIYNTRNEDWINMRVVAGSVRGFNLIVPSGKNTRPTTNRIKETLFNILQWDIAGCRFLDLFSGSGGIAIEALSRGAKEAVMVEKDREAVRCIKQNVQHTKMDDRSRVMPMDVMQALRRLEQAGQPFDIIFMDPPYGKDYEYDVLLALSHSDIVDRYTIIVIEEALNVPLDYIDECGFETVKVKNYKTNKHIFIRLKESE